MVELQAEWRKWWGNLLDHPSLVTPDSWRVLRAGTRRNRGQVWPVLVSCHPPIPCPYQPHHPPPRVCPRRELQAGAGPGCSLLWASESPQQEGLALSSLSLLGNWGRIKGLEAGRSLRMMKADRGRGHLWGFTAHPPCLSPLRSSRNAAPAPEASSFPSRGGQNVPGARTCAGL